MDEKKLTDEEIVKALGNCKKDNCIDCPYFIDEHSCKANILLADGLDLIHRLQDEIERLTEELDLWKDGEPKKLAYHNHIVNNEKLLTRANTVYRFSKRFMQLLNDEVLDYRNDLFVEIQEIVNKVSKEIMEGDKNEKSTKQNQS